MAKRIITFALALILCLSLIPGTVFAESGSSAQSIFNSAPLTPRQSVNTTLAKYVKEAMKEIDPKGALSTYQKVQKAHEWVKENIAFAEHYTLPTKLTTYLEDAAIYGFKEGKGPCEVDSAILVYLFRYIGLDAQWAMGQSPSKYHWWTEVIIGENIYAFDTYPGLVISFQHRTSSVQDKTKVNGFTFKGYWMRGGHKSYGVNENGNNIILSNVGTMDRMNLPSVKHAVKTVDYPDGTSYSWSIPFISERQMTMASIDKFYEPTHNKMRKDINKLAFAEIANKTVPVYTIKAGSSISIAGACSTTVVKLKLVDGKLQLAGAGPVDWGKDVVFTGSAQKVNVGDGKYYEVASENSTILFATEGYRLVELTAWSKYAFDTDPKSPTFGEQYGDYPFRHGYAVLQVKK